MPVELIGRGLVSAAGLYLLLGALFAPFFLLRGVSSIDPTARESGWGFRLILLPGVIALWPLLARRWASGQRQPPTECNAHRDAAGEDHS